MKFFKFAILTAIFGATFATPSLAQTDADYQAIKDALMSRPNAQTDIMGTTSNALRPLMHGRDYFEASDLDIYMKISAARLRAQNLTAILMYDLNGDMEVTREEIEQVVTFQMGGFGQPQQQIQLAVKQQVDRLMKSDKNGDGKLSGDELYANSQFNNFNEGQDLTANLGKALLAADPNKDGKVTQAEILAMIAHIAENGSLDAQAKKQ